MPKTAGNIHNCEEVNDAACMAHEVLALQESFDAAASLVEKNHDIACVVASDRDYGTPT